MGVSRDSCEDLDIFTKGAAVEDISAFSYKFIFRIKQLKETNKLLISLAPEPSEEAGLSAITESAARGR